MATLHRTRLAGPLCLVLLGSALRVWFVRHANPLTGDPLLYGNIARNLIEHHTYSFVAGPGPLPPTLIRLPGYPLFLAACFLLFGIGNFTAVLYVQLAIDLAACLLLAALARTLFGPRAAALSLVLSCLCPITANYTAIPLAEVLTLATITAAFFSLDRWRRQPDPRWALATGLALSASLLLRPEQALLSVAILPAMAWLTWRRLTAATPLPTRVHTVLAAPALAAACIVLPLAAWTARNWHTFHLIQPFAPRSATDPGEPIPSGFQHWYRTWAVDFASTEEVYWNYDGTPIALADLPSRAFDSPAQRAATAQILADYNVTTNPSPELDRRFEVIARARSHRHPFCTHIALPLARLANMLLRPRVELTNIQLRWWRWRDNPLATAVSYAYAALNLLYLALGLAGWRRWRRSARGGDRILLWAITAFVLLRCALLLTLDNSEPRYTLELFPPLILWASALAAAPRTINASSSSSS